MSSVELRKTIFPPSGRGKRLAVRGLRAYATTLPGKSAPFPGPGNAPVKILIQSMGGIGNTLMATPLIAATRQLYPQAKIDVLTTPGAAQLLGESADIDGVITEQDGDDKTIGGYRALNSTLRRERYDAALLTLNAVTFRFAVRAVLARIPRRAIHSYEFESWDNYLPAFNMCIPRDRSVHDVEDNLNLLRALAGEAPEPGALQLCVSGESNERAQQKLTAAGWREGVPTVALCPGSSGWMSFKRWPLERYIALTKRLIEHDEATQVVVFSGPEEEDERATWNSSIDSERFHLIHGLSLIEYPAAIRRMSVVVANDSLPMHLSAAMQTPVVAIFGPTHPSQTGPWSCPSRIVTPPQPFEAYFRIPYPLEPTQFPDVMGRISVDDVEAAVRSLIA